MASYPRFLLHSIAAVLMTLGSCAVVHWVVDPYDLFDGPKIEGVNKVKAVIGSKQRVFETVALLRRAPQVVIFGTSRSDIGIDTAHPAFKGMTRFNAAASGQQIGEAEVLLRTLVERAPAPPKIVVIGLDFIAFNALAPDPFDVSEENLSPWRRLELLFSISTTLDSFRTLRHQNYQYQLGLGGLLRDDGFREYIGNPALPRHANFEGSEEGFLRNNYNGPPHCRWATADLSRGRDYLESYRHILQIAHAKDIDLKLFISPSHARQWETLAASGLWTSFEQWKRDLVRINAEEAQRSGKPAFVIVDFSGYNPITTETVSDNPDMKYYWESSHYRKETGDQVLNLLFHSSPVTPRFGHALTRDNLEAWLAATRAAQAAYRKTHPADIAVIHALAAKVAKTSPCAARNLDQPVSAR